MSSVTINSMQLMEYLGSEKLYILDKIQKAGGPVTGWLYPKFDYSRYDLHVHYDYNNDRKVYSWHKKRTEFDLGIIRAKSISKQLKHITAARNCLKINNHILARKQLALYKIERRYWELSWTVPTHRVDYVPKPF